MTALSYRFGIISDPHIALPETVWQSQQRFHLVEVSLAAFEQAIAHLEQLGIDALLLPGDLTQHGEHTNHQWLRQYLSRLPFPTYVVPGNHDVIHAQATEQVLGLAEFPRHYAEFGYGSRTQPWYSQELGPGLQLIGLNSNQFNGSGEQLGYLDEVQLRWLAETLDSLRDRVVIAMVHHNTVEHLPDQLTHPLGRRYMLDNAPQVREVLRQGGVSLALTGHLHVQDVAQQDGLWEIATGSLVSYPHPYRLVELTQDEAGALQVQVQSFFIDQVPGYDDLPAFSREWLAQRSFPFMQRLVQLPPLSLPEPAATQLAQQLRCFWADVAQGDQTFSFSEQPASVRQWLERFSAPPEQPDNQVVLHF